MVRSEQNSDLWLLSLATAALFAEVLYLFWLLRVIEIPIPIEWQQYAGVVNTAPQIGSLKERRQAVRARSESSLSWMPMAAGDAVHARDTVMTGADASAIVQLEDGARIELGPDTLIHFPVARPGVAFLELELNRGKVRLLSGGQAKKVNFRSRSVVLQPESEMVVRTEPIGTPVSVELVKGQASIPSTESAEQAPVDVKAGDSLEVALTGEVSVRPTLLAVQALAPDTNVPLFLKSVPTMVSVRWTGEPVEKVEFSTSESFEKSQTVAAKGQQVLIPAQLGKNYWRLLQTEKNAAMEKNERHSTTFSFDAFRFPVYRLQPLEKSQLKEGRKIVFQWAPLADAESYLIEVAFDRGFQSKVFSQEVSAPRWEWMNEQGGNFFWRVTARSSALASWPGSEPQGFKVKARIAAPKAKGATFLDNPMDKAKKNPAKSRTTEKN